MPEKAIIHFGLDWPSKEEIPHWLFDCIHDFIRIFQPDIGEIFSYSLFRVQWKRVPSSIEVRARKSEIVGKKWTLVDPDCRVLAIHMRKTKKGVNVEIKCSDAPDFLDALMHEINKSFKVIRETWMMDGKMVMFNGELIRNQDEP